MNTADKIFEEVRVLPEVEAREVLDFVGYLKAKHSKQSKAPETDMSVLDQFGEVFNGKFDRDECYDRKGVL